MEQQVVGGDAGLPGIERLAPGDAACGDPDIGAAVHNAGALAAQLQDDGGQVACGRLHDDAAQFGASGEEDQVPAFAEQECIDIAVALYDGDILFVVDLGDHPCKGVGHVRGVGRGFEHGGASGRNGPHQGVEQQLHGVVPRGDDECRAERFGEDAAQRGLQLERRRPVLGTHPVPEVAQVVAHLAPHDAQLGEVGLLGRFVQVQPQRLTQRSLPLHERLLQAAEHRAAETGREGGSRAEIGILGRADCGDAV